jgi:hypothetical protein
MAVSGITAGDYVPRLQPLGRPPPLARLASGSDAAETFRITQQGAVARMRQGFCRASTALAGASSQPRVIGKPAPAVLGVIPLRLFRSDIRQQEGFIWE